MTTIDDLLATNARYAASRAGLGNGRPRKQLAVVTCMDARIDVLASLGLELGEAVVIRNAGARVTDDVLRSLAVATHVLGVDTVVVMQHSKCGLLGVTDDELERATGVKMAFLPIADHGEAIRHDIEMLTGKPYLAPVSLVAGFVYDVESGAIDEVHRWERAPHA